MGNLVWGDMILLFVFLDDEFRVYFKRWVFFYFVFSVSLLVESIEMSVDFDLEKI